jgi:hypothetical protein
MHQQVVARLAGGPQKNKIGNLSAADMNRQAAQAILEYTSEQVFMSSFFTKSFDSLFFATHLTGSSDQQSLAKLNTYARRLGTGSWSYCVPMPAVASYVQQKPCRLSLFFSYMGVKLARVGALMTT